jgi:hypothetical protein
METLYTRSKDLEKLVREHNDKSAKWETIIETHSALNDDLSRDCKVLESNNL